MQIKIFINECSYDNQFYSEEDFDLALASFRKILKAIFKLKTRFEGISISVWICATAIRSFIEDIDTISKDKSLKTDIERQLFDKLMATDWKERPLHSLQDKYFYLYWNTKENDLRVKDFMNSSLAEISERHLQYPEESYLLINFSASLFQEKKYIQIIKADTWNNLSEILQIFCIDNQKDFEDWFEKNHRLDSLFADRHRFEKTKIKVQGSNVFRESQTGYYWYYDNFHRDFDNKDLKKPVEIEVFDKQGKHIGVADLEGNIDFEAQKSDRTINVK
ncbi:MAG: hypothetical protein HC913_13045 [Microscillaceae bacterium]|nr:hypothetical protein [Microscillaceae bacterium]